MKIATRLKDTNAVVEDGECFCCHIEVCTHFDHLEKHPNTFYTDKYVHVDKKNWPQ